MSALRWPAAVLMTLVVLALAVAEPDQPKKPKDPLDAPDEKPAFQVPIDSKLGEKLQLARDHVTAENWAEACRVLQLVLDIPEDRFTEVTRTGADGKSRKVFVSGRAEANRILGEMPAEGRQVYQKAYGDQAQELLGSAREKKEEQHWRSDYLLVLARGREKQGKRVEALKAYLDLGLSSDENELISVPGDPSRKVTRSALAAAGMMALAEKASPVERKQMEQELERRWKEVQDSKDPKLLKRFVSLFGN